MVLEQRRLRQMIELDDNERQPCEVWTRVMGYFRPTMSFNKGKISEFKDRTYFNQKIALNHCKENQNDE